METRLPNIYSGRKTVTVAGTAERFAASSTTAKKVTIMAELDNGDYVVIGGSDVVAALATRKGIALSAGMSITLDIQDLYDLWIDAVVSGEGVSYIYQY